MEKTCIVMLFANTLLIILLIGIVSIRLSATPSDVLNKLQSIDVKIESVINRTDDRWTGSDQKQYSENMQSWLEKFRAENPDMIIPDFKE